MEWFVVQEYLRNAQANPTGRSEIFPSYSEETFQPVDSASCPIIQVMPMDVSTGCCKPERNSQLYKIYENHLFFCCCVPFSSPLCE